MKRNIFYLLAAVAAICAAETSHAQTNTSDPGVTINGVTWATRNVGVKGKFMDNSWSFGILYAFDDLQGACPIGWRTPTREEFETLIQSESEWTTENGVPGRRYGTGLSSLFMPAAGFRDSYGMSGGQSNDGYYWSSTPTEFAAWHLNFHPADAGAVGNNGNRSDCFSIRCVRF